MTVADVGDPVPYRMYFIVTLVNGWQPLAIVLRISIFDVVEASYAFDLHERKHKVKTEWKREESFLTHVAEEEKHFLDTK